MNLTVHFIRTRNSLILSCSSASFSFYIFMLLVGVMEGKKRNVDGRWAEEVGKNRFSLISPGE